jgi:hypothetical protein
MMSMIYAQSNYRPCQFGISVNPPDPRWRQVPSRFEVMTELSSANAIAELSQAFSPTRDSVALSTSDGIVDS